MPKLTNTACGIESTNAIRISTTAKYLNEAAAAHRHSFNESIYSEPYSGRFVTGISRRFEANHPNPLCESSSASNICGNKGLSANVQNYPINFLTTHKDIYGTIESITSNETTTYTNPNSNSTRSSIYSDRTILNEQSETPNSSCSGDEPTNKNSNKLNASNASGSPISLQAKIANESKIVSPVRAKQSEILSPQTAISESGSQSMDENYLNDIKCKNINLNFFLLWIFLEPVAVVGGSTVVIRRPKSSNNTADRPVRRISYLRATANDISVQESATLVECVEKLPLEKDQSTSDELQQLLQFSKL